MTTDAERMTAHWTWWRLLGHRLKGHEITHSSPDYPPPVCRTCEMAWYLAQRNRTNEGSKP